MRKNNKNDLDTLIVVLVQVVIILIIVMGLRISSYNSEKNKNESKPVYEVENGETEDNDEETETTVEETVSEQEETTSEETEEQQEKTEYEAPEYNFTTDEVTVKIKGLDREYTFAWVSDVHLITDFEKADDFRIEYVKTIKERNEEFVTDDGLYTKDIWPEVVKYLNYNDFDGFLFGADMMDYCSASNLDYFLTYYNQLNPEIPKIYIRSDHDYGFWYGGGAMTEKMAREKHAELFDDQNSYENMILEFDNFVIIGVNDSYLNMSENYYEFIQGKIDEASANNKQVIMMTHVPYESKVDGSLAELSMQVRNTLYYWGGESWQPDETTSKYFKNLYEEGSPVCQVIAGHLHASWDGMISDNVSQHIFAPAYSGSIGIIHIVPDEE